MPKLKKSTKPVQVMTKFKLNEISAVTKPAQGGALAVIMKRDDSDIDKAAHKKKKKKEKQTYTKSGDLVDLLTSAEEGHQHGIIVDPWDENDASHIRVDYAYIKDEEYSHDHKLLIAADGGITVSENNGHTHNIDADAMRDILFSRMINKSNENQSTIEFTNAADNGGLIAKETTMPDPKTVSQEDHDKVLKKVALLTALTSMPEIHKAHYATLDDAGQTAFIDKSAEDRGLDVELKKSADPVVYTADNGDVFLKSDDPKYVRMAKQNDITSRNLNKSLELNDALVFNKRADDELSHLPGNKVSKSALLRAVDGIEDEAIRKNVLLTLKAADDSGSSHFKRAGTTEPTINKSASDKLGEKISKYATDNSVSEVEANTAVMNTQEGRALYDQANQR